MTSAEIIAVLNSALFRDARSEAEIAKAAGIGANTIQNMRKTNNTTIKTLIPLCNTIGLEVVVMEKTGRKEGK